jgi:hypothetical protein
MRRWYQRWDYLQSAVQDQLQWLLADYTNRHRIPEFVLAFPKLDTMANKALLHVMMLPIAPTDRRQYINALEAYKANPYRAPSDGPFTFPTCMIELSAVLAYLHYVMQARAKGPDHHPLRMVVKGPGKPPRSCSKCTCATRRMR